MKITTVYLPEELLAWLKKESKRKHINQADIIRMSLQETKDMIEKEQSDIYKTLIIEQIEAAQNNKDHTLAAQLLSEYNNKLKTKN